MSSLKHQTTPTHAWCEHCCEIVPIQLHNMSGKDVKDTYFNPTDYIGIECRHILVTTYTDKP
jgi:hypothetical protein